MTSLFTESHAKMSAHDGVIAAQAARIDAMQKELDLLKPLIHKVTK